MWGCLHLNSGVKEGQGKQLLVDEKPTSTIYIPLCSFKYTRSESQLNHERLRQH